MSTFNVSTSEVATFLTCKQRWMYAHHPSYHLEPRTLGIALTRGVIGHKALEIFYGHLFKGSSYTEATQATISYLTEESLKAMSLSDVDKIEMITELMKMVMAYFEESKWILDKYELMEPEFRLEAPLPDEPNINFVGRVDQPLKVKSGPEKGLIEPWDHKFTYNFWPENALKVNAQISNYVWGLNQMGYRSRRGMMNMLRYRGNAIESFKQEEVITPTPMQKGFIKNHTVAAIQIVELKMQDTVSIEDGITRSPSKFNCEYCPFADLCLLELSGKDSSTMVKARFRPNSYGYDSVLDIE